MERHGGGSHGHSQIHQSIGLADKHFKPIEIEAKKIKEQQKSNLSKNLYFYIKLAEKLKAIEQKVQQEQMSQSQIAQARFYKNLTNKKQGPLASSLKKDGNGSVA